MCNWIERKDPMLVAKASECSPRESHNKTSTTGHMNSSSQEDESGTAAQVTAQC